MIIMTCRIFAIPVTVVAGVGTVEAVAAASGAAPVETMTLALASATTGKETNRRASMRVPDGRS